MTAMPHDPDASRARFGDTFRDTSVLVTGHTGFKGSWLTQWLLLQGARVTGFALEPPTTPSLYDELALSSQIAKDVRGDIREASAIRDVVRSCRPDFVFHLAAQPLVRLSYEQPLLTLETNALGTAHLLDALREVKHPCACVFATSDKCYENREWLHGYRETDDLGGHDPYSASKACAELIAASYRRSFFPPGRGPVSIATARAGNVVGGGDWAQDRLVPDCIRSLQAGEVIRLRNPSATRPWQHVLEPLSGYLLLAGEMRAAMPGGARPDPARLERLCSAFNFGPHVESNRTTTDVLAEVIRHWPGRWESAAAANAPHEAGMLHLATDKAFHLLGWAPRWDFASTIRRTVEWYKARHLDRPSDPSRVRNLTSAQIADYCVNPAP